MRAFFHIFRYKKLRKIQSKDFIVVVGKLQHEKNVLKLFAMIVNMKNQKTIHTYVMIH